MYTGNCHHRVSHKTFISTSNQSAFLFSDARKAFVVEGVKEG